MSKDNPLPPVEPSPKESYAEYAARVAKMPFAPPTSAAVGGGLAQHRASPEGMEQARKYRQAIAAVWDLLSACKTVLSVLEDRGGALACRRILQKAIDLAEGRSNATP